MSDYHPDTNVGNIEYIRKQDAVDMCGGYGCLAHFMSNIKPADVAPVVRCKDCIHNNDCDIQYGAQAGENFFCGFGERREE